MYKNKKILALIPARAGSKGLPQKNILPLANKSLIAWSINAAKNSRYVDKLIISTDDDNIADVARSYGCEVPFIRPDHLATDEASTIDVIMHAVSYFDDYDYLVLLEPTSPLRETNDIDSALEMLCQNRARADSIVSVSKVEATHPAFSVKIADDGLIRPYAGDEFKIIRRQDLSPLYFFEGTVYISDVKQLLLKKTFYHDRTMPYVVPRWKSIEIDERIDMICCEALIKNKHLLERGANGT